MNKKAFYIGYLLISIIFFIYLNLLYIQNETVKCGRILSKAVRNERVGIRLKHNTDIFYMKVNYIEGIKNHIVSSDTYRNNFVGEEICFSISSAKHEIFVQISLVNLIFSLGLLFSYFLNKDYE